MVFEDGFCFLLFASRFAAEWGVFYLFLVVRAEPCLPISPM